MIKYFTIFLWLVCSPSAQTINIKGKIVDGNSAPIKGAAVHLLNADKMELTDDNGEFTITDNSPRLAPPDTTTTSLPGKPHLPAVIYRTGPTVSMDEAYNVKGVLKAVVPQSLSADRADFGTVNELLRSSGIYITKTGYGGKTHYGKLAIGKGSGSRRVLPGANSGKSGQALLKSAASDVLVVAALGKNTYKMDISDLGADVGSIKLGDNSIKTYHGYTQLTFKHEGTDAYIVLPKTPHPARPSIWRSTFWDDCPELDLLMLSKGYYLLYIPAVKGKLGNKEGVKLWENLYDLVVNYYRFWPRVVLSGWSRAGFQIFHFAGYNPEKVSVVAADAACCNVRAWPSGNGLIQKVYGMSKAELKAWDQNPSDSAIIKPMVEGGVAVIHEVRIDDHKVTPDWCYTMQKAYVDRGGVYKVHKKEGNNHVAHMLNPEEIEPFITEHNPLPEK